MDKIIKKLEEQISFMQQEILEMSDEIFAQQKEITKLTVDLLNLKNKIQDVENSSGMRNVNEEIPPPHY